MTQQLDFKVTDRFGREHTFTTYEGDFSSFVREGMKYSHHPLEVMYLLHDDPQFKHLPLGKLCSLVKKHGVGRQCGVGQGWNYSILGPAFKGPHLHDLEVNPGETIFNVAHHGGLSCMCCDGMVWEEPEIGGDGHIVDEYSKTRINRTRFSEVMSEQSNFSYLFDSYCTPALAPFCKECLKKANWAVGVHRTKRKPENRYSFRFERTDALIGLLGIYKSMLPPKVKKARRLSGGRLS